MPSRRHDPEDPTVKVSLTIRQSQKKWTEDNHINLSSVLREALEKMMKRVKYV